MLQTILQIVAIAAGFVSAFYWWRASAHVAKVYKGPPPEEGVGDYAFAMAVGDENIVYDFLPGSKLGARGALFAAISIGAQALTAIPGLFALGA